MEDHKIIELYWARSQQAIQESEDKYGPYCRSIARGILDREEEKGASRDYKTALQEMVQRESGQVLTYRLTGAEGPDHAKVFSMEVDLNGATVGQGKGHSKKEAEQNAARAAIEALNR